MKLAKIVTTIKIAAVALFGEFILTLLARLLLVLTFGGGPSFNTPPVTYWTLTSLAWIVIIFPPSICTAFLIKRLRLLHTRMFILVAMLVGLKLLLFALTIAKITL